MVHLRSSAADTCLLRPRRAATLPIAGLTALYALDRGGPLLGRSVLITSASGGVGQFVCQPARPGGAARVVGVVRFVAHAEEARAAGAQEVGVGQDNAGAACFGPYGVIPGSTCCTRPPRILPHFHPGSRPRADIALYETTYSSPPQEEHSTRTAWPR